MIPQVFRSVQLPQLPLRHSLNVRRQPPRLPAVEQRLGLAIRKGGNYAPLHMHTVQIAERRRRFSADSSVRGVKLNRPRVRRIAPSGRCVSRVGLLGG
jgi:hypothetical protein